MAITDKTRKQLWAKSGNICAICHCALVKEKTEEDSFSIVGDECHIVSEKPNGPRHVPNNGDYDDISNLILLCRTDHKMVDEQIKKFSIDYLQSLKYQHENWVSESLKNNKTNYSKSNKASNSLLPRVNRGKELCNIFWNAYGSMIDYDEFSSGEEKDTIAGFLQLLQDYADIDTVFEIGQRIDYETMVSNELKQIEDMGFWVFAKREMRKVKHGDYSHTWPIAILMVVRKDNPEIIKIAV